MQRLRAREEVPHTLSTAAPQSSSNLTKEVQPLLEASWEVHNAIATFRLQAGIMTVNLKWSDASVCCSVNIAASFEQQLHHLPIIMMHQIAMMHKIARKESKLISHLQILHPLGNPGPGDLSSKLVVTFSNSTSTRINIKHFSVGNLSAAACTAR